MRFHVLKEKRCIGLLFSLVLITSLAASAQGQASDDRNRTGPMFKSTDGGASWTAINTGFVAQFVLALTIDPANPEIIYAGSDRSIFKSTDGGSNWIVPNGDISFFTVQAIAVDPATPSTIYAATSSGGIYKSTDGASNWSRINSGLESAKFISRLVVDPANPSVLYLGTSQRIFKSQDGGSNWVEVLKLPSTGDIGFPDDLIIDPRNSSTVYAMGSGRIYKTTDGGQKWEEIGRQITSPMAIAVAPVNSTLYVVNGTVAVGLSKSTDGGNNWTGVTLNLSQLPPFSVRKMAIDPVNNSTFYWATSQGVFKSTDSGSNWIETGLSASKGYPSFVYSVVINPVNTSTIYASTNGVVSSDDMPWIRNVSVEGKKLLVTGDSFDSGAVILLDGEPQKTSSIPENPTRTLVGKKAGKKVTKNPETRIQIRNANGKLSQIVVRPVD